MSIGTITLDCAFETIMKTSGTSNRKLRDPKNFKNYVYAVYPTTKKWGHTVITINDYLKLQGILDPDREANGRRTAKTWAGPRVSQGYNRLDQRPRWDRRGAITSSWEVSKNLSEYVNFSSCQVAEKKGTIERRTKQSKTSMRRTFEPEIQSSFKLLRGKEQYWDHLMN